MANYHILTQEKEQRTINIVFHIPVPAAGTNEAGLSWRNAIVLDQGGSNQIVSVLTGISTAEDTQLKAGELFEVSKNLRFSKLNLTNAQKKAEIEAEFNSLTSSVIAEKQITLAWIGYEGDVA